MRTVEHMHDVAQLWNEALSILADDNAVSPQQRAFAALTVPKSVHNNVVTLAAPNEFTRNVVESHLKPHVAQALSQVLDRHVVVDLTVDPSINDSLDEETTDTLADSTYATRRNAARIPDQPSHVVDVRESRPPSANRDDDAHRLNTKYLFETFVIGSSNQFAHAAAFGVAERPAKAYNPLFIYGESGLGKTHLLHAIGHYTRALYAGTRVRYVSSNEFTNDFINSIRNDRGASFKARYRSVDVLLIDDIQFLSDKPETQEEFFHTFNALHNAEKQIVITSDLPPKELAGFEDRLRSRFTQGLTTDIQPPDLETRIAILRKKTAQEHINISPEVLEFIASKIATNIRELEGALIRVTAFASLNGSQVDVSLAELVLKDLLRDQHGPQVTIPLIMQQTADYFGVTIDDLCSESRKTAYVHARQVAMYLCRDLTAASLPQTGQHFGGRDHTTVMHADRKIKGKLATDRQLYNQVTELTSRIKAAARN